MANNIEAEVSSAKPLASKAEYKDKFELYEVLNKIPKSFPCFLVLLKLALTIPVSTASEERFFLYVEAREIIC